MATFLAHVRASGEAGYTASFADYPECSVTSSTIDEVITLAREALLRHLGSLLDSGSPVQRSSPLDIIPQQDGLILAAIDIPDDLRTTEVVLTMPALSLARLESVADRRGMSLAALFVKAVDRWAREEHRVVGTEGEGGTLLFDFGSPAELRVEAAAAHFGPAPQGQAMDDGDEGDKTNTITAELALLLNKAKP